MEDNKILIIDYSNFEDYPVGGYLTFAKYLMRSFSEPIALIGITSTRDEPIGIWFRKIINGIEYDFFALKRYNKTKTKHIIPDRLMSYLTLRYYKKEILKKNFQNVFIQRQEILPAVKDFNFSNICYRFPGLDNPLVNSKYKFARFLPGFFDKIFFPSLKNAKVILATGNDKEIEGMIVRSRNLISKDIITKFPTRVNTDIFKPLDKHESRKLTDIPKEGTVVITSGRLSWFKGWQFMIDCFVFFLNEVPDSYFYFVGDGEEYNKIRNYITTKNISERVVLVGRKTALEMALYLNASDLFIMGSYQEGWSTTLSEAIACGIPSCVTNFSSADEIIVQGRNGYVVDNHDEGLFVEGMLKSLKIERPVYNENVKRYSVDRLKEDLLNAWKLV